MTRSARMAKVRNGVWGGAAATVHLPTDVLAAVAVMQRDDSADWTRWLSSGDKQDWLVARLWEDESHFVVIAAVIKHETPEQGA